MTSGSSGKSLFLIDRHIVKDRWWTTSVEDAMIFNKYSAAEAQAAKLMYKHPTVITLEEAESRAADMLIDSLDDETHILDAHGQW